MARHRRLFRFPWRTASQVRADVDDELAFHLEMRAAELVQQGVEPVAARRRALAEFGDLEGTRQTLAVTGARQARRERRFTFLDELAQDVRYGLRGLARRPAFTIVALLTLALGTGANTTIFSIVRGVLLRPLPFPEDGRLYTLSEQPPEPEAAPGPPSYVNFLDYRAQSRSFAVAGAASFVSWSLTGGARPEQLRASAVSDGWFEALGVPAALGRTFTPEETGRGGDVTVLSHELWQRQYGGDPAILGRTVTLDGRPYQVVGIMLPGRGWPDMCDLWTPLGPGPTDRSARSPGVMVVARLADGVSPERAAREVATIGARLAAAHPKENGGWSPRLVSLRDDKVGRARPRLLLLAGAVGCVLLVACANLAHMLLARGEERRREFAVRVAVGASRGRIVRQLATESLLLSLAGSVMGLLISAWLLPAFLRLLPDTLPRQEGVRIDLGVLVFALAVGLATGLLFGLVPARRASRPGLAAEVRTGSATPAGWRARGPLVVSEVALATVLLVGAGLLLKSFVALERVDPGFDPRPVATVGLVLSEDAYPTAESRRQFVRAARQAIGALPGVSVVGAGNFLPLSFGDSQMPVSVPGRPDRPLPAGVRVVTPGYMEALSMRLVRGRLLGEVDRPDGAPTVIVNQALARRLFGNADPIGRTLGMGQWDGSTDELTVVGVVGDVRHFGRAAAVTPEAFLPYDQHPWGYMNLVVRAERTDPGAAAALLPEIRRVVQAIDPVRPLFGEQTMLEMLERDGAEPRFSAVLVGAFAGLALLLSAVGIAGVMAFSVATRRREIGIRMALGATVHDVLLLTLGPGLALVGAGVALGALGALGLARLIESQLFGVAPRDPAVFSAAVLVLGAVGVVACWLPTRRAAEVDPALAFRAE